MKTTDPHDPLDQKIDELLSRQPVEPSADFAERTRAEAENQAPVKESGALAPILRFALPLAAAVALAFVIFNPFRPGTPEAPASPNGLAATDPSLDEQELNSYEVQEILLLQEGLSGFAQVESDDLNGGELLNTLETLYSI